MSARAAGPAAGTAAEDTVGNAGRTRTGYAHFWFDAVPLARVAWVRAVVYLFVPVDVLLNQSWVRGHARDGAALYRPLFIARLAHLPTPTLTSTTLLAWLLVAAAVVAATGWRPRLTGSLAGILYLLWMLVAMSYGKVDHDRLTFLVALAVLPTVGAARFTDRRASPAAGWALRCIQIAAVLTYFYASWAKIRFGGWDWPTGAVLERALLRRSTVLSHWMINRPELLVPMQFAMIGMELASPLILLARSDRARSLVVAGLLSFHLMVFAGVTIIFLPHCVALCAFLPLERSPALARTILGRIRGTPVAQIVGPDRPTPTTPVSSAGRG